MRPFAGKARFPKSICNALIDGLDKRLMAIFHRNYVNHTVLHDLQASYQRSQFPIILQAMQLAEDEVHFISAIARSSVIGQAFKSDALAFPSQAERTLAHYLGGYSSDGGASGGYKSDGGASSGYRSDGSYCLDRLGGSKGEHNIGQCDSCFGCKGIHPWMKNGVVVCPNANKPGICMAPQAAYKKWLEKSKACRENRKRNCLEVDYNKLSTANKAKVKEAVLASMSIPVRNDGDTTPSKDDSSGSCTKIPVILMVDIVVLLSATASCDILPALIVSNFLQICLQLGSNLDCPNCPLVHCVVDTAAALSTGNFHFVAAVAKRYPHCLAKLYVPQDYIPIVLSGIIQHGGESITTELTVGFQFHLPYYLTKEGNPMSILIVMGPHVTVNMIVGLPIIQTTWAVIDLADNVADLRALDAPPFSLEYRRATVHVPAAIGEGDKHPVHMTGTYANLISKINALEHYFTSAHVITTAMAEGGVGVHQVRFGASPIKSDHILPSNLQSALAAEGVKHGFVDNPMDNYSDPDMGIGMTME